MHCLFLVADAQDRRPSTKYASISGVSRAVLPSVCLANILESHVHVCTEIHTSRMGIADARHRF